MTTYPPSEEEIKLFRLKIEQECRDKDEEDLPAALTDQKVVSMIQDAKVYELYLSSMGLRSDRHLWTDPNDLYAKDSLEEEQAFSKQNVLDHYREGKT